MTWISPVLQRTSRRGPLRALRAVLVLDIDGSHQTVPRCTNGCDYPELVLTVELLVTFAKENDVSNSDLPVGGMPLRYRD